MSEMLPINEVVESVSITHKFDKPVLKFLNTSDVENGKIINVNHLPIEELKGQAKKTIKKHDILFSEIRPKNRRFAYVDFDDTYDFVVSTKLMVLRKFNPNVDNKYFYYFLTNDHMLSILQDRAENRIGSFPQITFDLLSEYSIRVPHISEQQKIASVLSALDSKIELNNRINAELEAMAKTIYDYWFVQFDFPDKNGKPYKTSGGKMVWNEELKREIPKDWAVNELRKLIEIQRGISYTSKDIEGDGVPMINLNSFNLNGTYKAEGVKYYSGKYSEKNLIKNGDLLIAATDVTRNAEIIGKAILVPDYYTDSLVFSMDIAKISSNHLPVSFLMMLFNSNHYHNYIKWYATGTLVLHLNLDGVNRYVSEIPPSNILHMFDVFYMSIANRIYNTAKENKELSELRDWLLPMLMNGQVKVI